MSTMCKQKALLSRTQDRNYEDKPQPKKINEVVNIVSQRPTLNFSLQFNTNLIILFVFFLMSVSHPFYKGLGGVSFQKSICCTLDAFPNILNGDGFLAHDTLTMLHQ